MLLVVDNGSIYTKDLVNFLTEIKIPFVNKKYDEIVPSEITNFDSFILSGRKKNDRAMNSLNSKIVQHAVEKKKNLLGICYGAEILTLTLGGTIKRSPKPEKGQKDVDVIKGNSIFYGTLRVFESHSYEIAQLGYSLSNIAKSSNCFHEIIQFDNLNIFGTQFHPEMSLDGKKILEKFVLL